MLFDPRRGQAAGSLGRREEMDAKSGLPECPVDAGPVEVLQEFVRLFSGKGWLNRGVRISRREKRYRIYCSEEKFIAHRINEPCAGPWGFPCWAVCLVTGERVLEDSHLSGFASAEPGVREWLRCIAEEDFEIL